jgi:hypothetical protein
MGKSQSIIKNLSGIKIYKELMAKEIKQTDEKP